MQISWSNSVVIRTLLRLKEKLNTLTSCFVHYCDKRQKRLYHEIKCLSCYNAIKRGKAVTSTHIKRPLSPSIATLRFVNISNLFGSSLCVSLIQFCYIISLVYFFTERETFCFNKPVIEQLVLAWFLRSVHDVCFLLVRAVYDVGYLMH